MSNLVIDVPALADQLRRAAKAYYDTDQLEMTDAEYDAGIEQLRIAVAEDPALAPTCADLLEKVAGGQSGGGDVVHPSMMGSLEKATTLEGVAKFVDTVGSTVMVEPKLDGLAIRVEYVGGRLALAATRGDGRVGEDITAQVRALSPIGLPVIAGNHFTGQVRGEVFMADADLPRAQAVRVGLGGEPFVNARNAAAGILRKGDYAFAGLLSFAAYGADGESIRRADDDADGVGEYSFDLDVAAQAGIQTVGTLTLRLLDHEIRNGHRSVDEVLDAIDFFGKARANLGFPIDGVVIKADRRIDQQRLGEGSRAPKWAIAYKYDAETATTRVSGITTSVGKTGRMGIRIEVEPVFVGGTTVTYATGHNATWMATKDIRIGDTVVIKRANDVIPYIESVVLADRPADAMHWLPPQLDPNGNPWDKSTLLWRSTDPSLSVGALIRYAASRDALDIEGIGTEIVEALVEQGLVGDISDLFDLSADVLAALPLGENRTLGAKNAAKIVAEIDKARTAPWNRVITALGMRMTGRTMSRRLAAALPTAAALLAASTADLAAVDGIGDVKAQVIHDEIARNRWVLARLALRGVQAADEHAQASAPTASGPLAGMTIVVSGSVPGYSRTTVAELIESLGGKASGSVSATTSLLVSDPSTSSKYVTATKLGVRIVTPAEFMEMAK